MLRREDIMVIKALKAGGVYQKDIAEQLGVHPKTVSRALKQGEGRRRERQGKASKLEPYKTQVDQLLAEVASKTRRKSRASRSPNGST